MPHAAFQRVSSLPLQLEKEVYEADGKRLGYDTLAGKLKGWKKEDTVFLSEAHLGISGLQAGEDVKYD